MTELLFDIPRTTVQWTSGGKDYGFSVRGLSDEDIATLVRSNREDLEKAFGAIENLQGANPKEIVEADAMEFGKALLDVTPELVAQMIALATDQPDKASVIRRMPAPIKLRALSAVWQLTVIDTGGLEPFLQQVLSLVKGLRTSMDSVKAKLKA